MSREVELGWASWTPFASSCPSCSSTAVQRTLSLWLCPSTAVETAIAQCTSRWAIARRHCLNISIVLAAVIGLSGLFRAVSAVEPSLSRPLPTLSPSLISHLASVDVKQQWRRRHPDIQYHTIAPKYCNNPTFFVCVCVSFLFLMILIIITPEVQVLQCASWCDEQIHQIKQT